MRLKVIIMSVAAAIFMIACGNEDTSVSSIAQPIGGVQHQNPKDKLLEEYGLVETIPQEVYDALEESSKANMGDGYGAEFDPTVRIRISLAGDVTLGATPDRIYENSFDAEVDARNDYSWFWANVRDIFTEDTISICNLEGPLTNEETAREGREITVKGKPEYIEILTSGGIDAVALSNNHIRDFGQAGLDETKELLENNNISYAIDDRTSIIECDGGIKVGLVSFISQGTNSSIDNIAKNGISKLKENGADIIVVFAHWGDEKDYYPDDYQIKLGHNCIDWGADLVVGAHPHVLQGIENYNGKYIAYSLGNFCFGANRNPSDKDTMIFQEDFIYLDNELIETEARIIPCSVSSDATRNNFQPTPLIGASYDKLIEKVRDLSKDFVIAIGDDGILRY